MTVARTETSVLFRLHSIKFVRIVPNGPRLKIYVEQMIKIGNCEVCLRSIKKVTVN